MRIEIPELHQNQESVYESKARFRVVMCGRRFGKSELAITEIVINGVHGKQVAYITPTYNLAKAFFDKLAKAVPFPANRSELTIQFVNGGSVQFFTGERLDNLRGRKFHLVVIDEASFIPDLETGWLNSIRPTLTDYKGRALFLSTPRGKNYFFSLYNKGLNGEPDWQSFKFSTYDNPYIDAYEIDDARRQLPEAVFNQEYMADPAENAANPFGLAFIQQCTYPISQTPPAVYGIDLAKSVDFTVIIGLDSTGSVCYFDRFQKDWRQTRTDIKRLPRAPMLVDSSGVGDPIVEDLMNDGLDATGFKFSNTSKQQIMLGLVSAVQQRKITFPEGPITRELETIEYQFGQYGVKYAAPQGFHDDCVMALALAYNHFTNYGQSAGRYSFS
jgi:hypothetical protein